MFAMVMVAIVMVAVVMVTMVMVTMVVILTGMDINLSCRTSEGNFHLSKMEDSTCPDFFGWY